MGPFLLFHIYLIVQNKTTLEFIEGSSHVKQRGTRESSGTQTQLSRLLTSNKNARHKPLRRAYNIYNIGVLANMKQALGPRVVLWWLPIGSNSPYELTYPLNEQEFRAFQDDLDRQPNYNATAEGGPIE